MARTIARWLLAIAYLLAGYLHVTMPAPFLSITPDWVPFPAYVIYWTGMAEVAGAVGLLQPFGPRLRQAAGIGLALYALCVWPANINHFAMDMARTDNGLGLAYHVPRMILQPVLIWLALWVGNVIDWPFGRNRRHAR
ncbi:hypothetical protein D6851_15325 [Altericroceibacterium spongiae]|uniref:DoxX family membrane protein n=1 Tax=Altericroceibacterium spongiae TaxID=2320269 RepID=A0A420EBW4_9SPHN|nr:DoxX family protein [Altericroceibacterium spongiae]RKF18187.1 hypothetical protein D6851_15325 [Altericroceibacterium spongiae]